MPIVLMEYPNRPEAVITVIIQKNYSRGVEGEISP